ncbi:MAG: META domain-containing protein [Saprospiraceae bacterium]|nr:META domain-containing protein [Candidatus Opimibacter iunctus]
MKQVSVLLISILSLCSGIEAHATGGQERQPSDSIVSNDDGDQGQSVIYFKANGVDPVWSLTISAYQIDFKTQASGFESISAPHVEPVKGMDSNIKTYKVKTETGQMEVEIAKMLCQNEGSKERFPYAVTIMIRQGSDTTYTYFTGCGQYVTDSRLEARWVLSHIKSEPVTASQFNDTLPNLSLHANGNSFTGYCGCNIVNGHLFSERTLLRFTNMVYTKRLCPTKAKEDEFIKGLEFSTNYAVDGDQLTLSNYYGVTLVFKRVE